MIEEFINKHKLPSSFLHIAEHYYSPLADKITSHHNSADIPYFVGINGSQGSGKSTLADYLKAYLEDVHHLNVVVMSLDDFYYSQQERAILSGQVHPLFKTRGVPGTHNTGLIKQALTRLKSADLPVTIPRFDKSTDNPYPQANWTTLNTAIDIVIFEGWCWGVAPQNTALLHEPVNALEKEQDPHCLWRNYVNMQLGLHYQPLYEHMDMWVMCKAPSFDDVFAWRLEQEQKLIAALGTDKKAGIMSAPQIQAFIQHYQRLTEHCLATLPASCDHVFELNSQRDIVNDLSKDTRD